MSLDYKILGGRIRKLRKSKGFSQEYLAELADLSVTYIGQVERAERHIGLESMLRIAAALNVSADRLLRGNQSATGNELDTELNEFINDCDGCEKQIILDMISALKNSLRRNTKIIK